ncbi:response regulator transcription factor [Massilia niabensis]|uniref:Response regulator transcription factor n=1 Tax=Massilia niabensis TaxID=544910 RepID=A0ABW0L6L5_9BURK
MRSEGDGGTAGSTDCVQAYDPHNATVCVVDDDPAVRSAMINLLEASGFNALVFDSGEAFFASAHLKTIDFAVFDIKLRGMDGFAIQERCVALGLDLPVLFISGHGGHDMEQRALQAGALALLRKPVDPELLCAYMEDRLGTCRVPS